MNIYAGNLSPETREDDLCQTFGAFGEVASAKILKDRATGKSNGFGFVGMAACDEGQTAISDPMRLLLSDTRNLPEDS